MGHTGMSIGAMENVLSVRILARANRRTCSLVCNSQRTHRSMSPSCWAMIFHACSMQALNKEIIGVQKPQWIEDIQRFLILSPYHQRQRPHFLHCQILSGKIFQRLTLRKQHRSIHGRATIAKGILTDNQRKTQDGVAYFVGSKCPGVESVKGTVFGEKFIKIHANPTRVRRITCADDSLYVHKKTAVLRHAASRRT
jgi:hypothetical protein